ncbi:MAG: Secretion system C-terminal sorting domain [Bacteroidetes bacterium]|jgi:hypothetical protein|nr:Secretion system C-terminal sorting domain [Bacteroidota bacterium]MDF2452825.1 Secretion system C-terminal sorting domain [Bacteroidota bacterium]
MKIIIHLYCVALTFAFYISYGQTSSSEPIARVAGKLATKDAHGINSLPTNCPTPNITEDEIIVTPEVKAYPEPFEGIVSVNLNTYPDAQISVCDSKGNCVKSQKCANEERAIFDLRDQPKGIYYLEIKAKGGKTVKAIYLQQNF